MMKNAFYILTLFICSVFSVMAATESPLLIERLKNDEALLPSLQEDRVQLRRQLVAAEKQIVEINRRHEQQVSELSEQIEGLKAAVTRSEMQEAEQQNTALKEQVESAAAENERLKQQIEAEKETAASAMQAKANQLEETEKKVAELEVNLAKSHEETRSAESRTETLEKQYRVASTELESAKAPTFLLKKNPSDAAKANYASGVYYATRVRFEMQALEGLGYSFMPRALLQGMKDKFNNTTQISDAEVAEFLTALDGKAGEKNRLEAEKNKAASERFIAQAEKAKGAVKASNGVIYRVIKTGANPLLSKSDNIRFKLDEKISTGKKLSVGEMKASPIDQLPEIMQQGVLQLGVGGKVKITVPWQLAYGDKGIPGTIPPGVASELTIEVTGINQ